MGRFIKARVMYKKEGVGVGEGKAFEGDLESVVGMGIGKRDIEDVDALVLVKRRMNKPFVFPLAHL